MSSSGRNSIIRTNNNNGGSSNGISNLLLPSLTSSHQSTTSTSQVTSSTQRIDLSRGRSYIGSVHTITRKPEGAGTKFDALGRIVQQCDSWHGGKMNGHGYQMLDTGGKYSGQFVNGIWHGSGRFISEDGHTYEGSWSEGTQHGRGRITFSNGDISEGKWKENQQVEFGVHWNKEGCIQFIGKYENGVPKYPSCSIPRDALLYGTFLSKQEKNASLLFPNGDYYYGEYSLNLPHGYGKMYDSGHKLVYEGEYCNGVPVVDEDEEDGEGGGGGSEEEGRTTTSREDADKKGAAHGAKSRSTVAAGVKEKSKSKFSSESDEKSTSSARPGKKFLPSSKGNQQSQLSKISQQQQQQQAAAARRRNKKKQNQMNSASSNTREETVVYCAPITANISFDAVTAPVSTIESTSLDTEDELQQRGSMFSFSRTSSSSSTSSPSAVTLATAPVLPLLPIPLHLIRPSGPASILASHRVQQSSPSPRRILSPPPSAPSQSFFSQTQQMTMR